MCDDDEGVKTSGRSLIVRKQTRAQSIAVHRRIEWRLK